MWTYAFAICAAVRATAAISILAIDDFHAQINDIFICGADLRSMKSIPRVTGTVEGADIIETCCEFLTRAILLAFVDIFAVRSVASVAGIAKTFDRANSVNTGSICIAVVERAFVDVSAFYFSISFVTRVAGAFKGTRKIDTSSESHARIICAFINVEAQNSVTKKTTLASTFIASHCISTGGVLMTG